MPTVNRPPPTLERAKEIRRYRSSFEVMCGVVTEPAEVKPFKDQPPEYVWDKHVSRYRWRKGTKKCGKFHCVPNIPKEQRLYRERLERKRKDALQKKQGNRLKKR